jgi:hypothetical protein
MIRKRSIRDSINYERSYQMKPYVCLLILSLTLVSCNKSESPTTPSGTTDFVPVPLKVGNTWIYSITASGQTGRDTFSIVNTTTMNSQTVYVLNDQWLFDKNGAYYNEGVLYGMRVTGPDQKIEVIYPKNPVVGQQWHVSDVESTFKLEALGESVSVPAGTFSCSRIRLTPDDPAVDAGFVWFSDTKGIIKATLPSEIVELVSLVIN